MYERGQGVQQDYKEAVRLYRMSADQGFAEAQLNLGEMYNDGYGVPQDYVYAYAWYNIAKSNGDENARNILDRITKEMTKEQIAEAMSLSTEIYKRIEANTKD